MKTNTNRDAKRVRDALVCHAMGWEFYKLEMAFGKMAFVAYPPGEDLSGLPETFEKSTFEELAHTKNRQISKSRIPPFTTEPTYETDGVVLEWVQGRHELISEMQFNNAVRGIITKRQDEPEQEQYYLNFFLRHYKPGDYALALEAVMEERDAVDNR